MSKRAEYRRKGRSAQANANQSNLGTWLTIGGVALVGAIILALIVTRQASAPAATTDPIRTQPNPEIPRVAVADAQAGCVCTEAGFQYDKASNRCVEPTPCRSANAEGTTGPTGPLVYSSPPPSNGRGRTASPGYQWGQYDVRTCSSTPPGNTNGSSVKPSRKSPAGTSQ